MLNREMLRLPGCRTAQIFLWRIVYLTRKPLAAAQRRNNFP